MRLPRECHNQSRSLRHWTGTAFLSQKKGMLKIDQSVKMSWHRLSMGVACSYSSAPADTQNVFYFRWYFRSSQLSWNSSLPLCVFHLKLGRAPQIFLYYASVCRRPWCRPLSIPHFAECTSHHSDTIYRWMIAAPSSLESLLLLRL